jgi:hypothetical protein
VGIGIGIGMDINPAPAYGIEESDSIIKMSPPGLLKNSAYRSVDRVLVS